MFSTPIGHIFVNSNLAQSGFESSQRFSPKSCSLPTQSKRTPEGVHALRRERDSNPRGAFTPNSFQDCRLQPLSHLSIFIQLWHSNIKDNFHQLKAREQ